MFRKPHQSKHFFKKCKIFNLDIKDLFINEKGWMGIDDKIEFWALKRHLSKSSKAKILPYVIVREVPKTSHPHVCSNENTNGIVYL